MKIEFENVRIKFTTDKKVPLWEGSSHVKTQELCFQHAVQAALKGTTIYTYCTETEPKCDECTKENRRKQK